jgi:hypothetical protein
MGVPRATSAPVFGGEEYTNMAMNLGEMGYAPYMSEHQLLGSSFSGAYDPAGGALPWLVLLVILRRCPARCVVIPEGQKDSLE